MTTRKIISAIVFTCLVSTVCWTYMVCAQEAGPAPAQTPAIATDPSVTLYRKLAGKIRSELQRRPEMLPDASKPLSLEDCLALAQRNNGKLLISREKLLAAKMRYTEARRNLLPTLKFVGYLREGLLTSKTFKGENYKIESEYDVIDGNKKFYNLEQAKQNYILTKKTYERLRNDILYQTRQVYYLVYRSQLQYQEQLALFGKVRGLVAKGKDLLDKKLLRNVDYIGLVSTMQEMSAQLLAASQELTNARLGLCQMLHYYPEDPIQIHPLPEAKPLGDVKLEQCLNLAFRYRPDIALALLTNDLQKLGVELAKASTGFKLNANGHFGHKGEAFNEAIEGIQTRPDLKLALKNSMPLDQHTLSYDADLVKEVPNVGSTTSTVYNSHTATFSFFDNTRERQILEARIAYHDSIDNLESLKKFVISDVARRYLEIGRAQLSLETAGLGYQLAEERYKVAMSAAGETGVSPEEELRATIGVSFAKRRVVDASTGYVSSVNDLNRAVGLDNYYDPFAATINIPKDEPFRRIKKVWEFWRDDELEQDQDLMPAKFYEDYLKQ